MAYRRYKKNYNDETSFVLLVIIYTIILPLVILYYFIKLILYIIKMIEQNKKKAECSKYTYTSFSYDKDVEHNSSLVTNQNITYDTECNQNSNNSENNQEATKYQKKDSLISNYEKYFYDILEQNFGYEYKVQTQVNLASIITKIDNCKYQNELYRNIDFGIFDKNTLKPLLLIEINDSTHKNSERYKRDMKVREIISEAKIKLITFYSSYKNETKYVVERIKKSLNEP